MKAANNGSQSIYAGPGVIGCADCEGFGRKPAKEGEDTTCTTCKGKGERRKTLGGFTKREYMATEILAGICANPEATYNNNDCAEGALRQADALLEALEK